MWTPPSSDNRYAWPRFSKPDLPFDNGSRQFVTELVGPPDEGSAIDQKVRRLEDFKKLLLRWFKEPGNVELRSVINQQKNWVRRQVIEAHCYGTLTVSPPPAVGGLLMRRVDPFTMLFDEPYGLSIAGKALEMIDETIGALKHGEGGYATGNGASKEAAVEKETRSNYAIVLMPMAAGRPELDDVLDAIKEGADRCGILAERIDEQDSTERITDRVLAAIRGAEFVIADLSSARPNVYFEAGYAHALGKTPVYVARKGTAIAFDLKDFPIVFFGGMRELKDALEKRLRGLRP
jgi:hypothetical protein